MAWFSNLPHTWEGDPRDPLFTFSLGGESFDFHNFSLPYVLTFAVIVVIESLVAALVSLIVYRYILKNQGATSSYLIGYGIIFPFWILTPSYVIQATNTRNLFFRLALASVTPVICMFRTTEAMHGFAPEHVKKSEGRYAYYYSCPLFGRYDKKTDKYINGRGNGLVKVFLELIVRIIVSGSLQAVLVMFPKIVPLNTKPSYSSWYSVDVLIALLDWKQVLRTLVISLFMQNFLVNHSTALVFFQQLVTGIAVEPIMENPTLQSKSPSEFWGRRWNIVIHESLKRGVFKPLRRYCSKYVCVGASFFASGLFHEFLLLHMFPIWEKKHFCFGEAITDDCYMAPYGFSMGFFLWQAVLISVEFTFGHWSIFKNIPGPVATFLTLCAGGLVGHWFYAPYIDSSFFLDGRPATVTISPSQTN